MDVEVMSDPYELKLYQMFQSCDKKQSGLLNTEAVKRLCELLELRDKGAVLLAGLAVARPGVGSDKESVDNGKPHVSFERFKEALLNFLGTELDGSTTTTAGPAACLRERTLIISDEVETFIDSPPESSDREVSPKLVKGSKKYGRRSRPQGQQTLEFLCTDSDEGETARQLGNSLVQRSSSQSDIPANRRRRPTVAHGGSKLKRCASLPAQQNRVKAALGGGVNNNNNNNKLKGGKSPQTAALASSVESLGNDDALARAMAAVWRHNNNNNNGNSNGAPNEICQSDEALLACAQVCVVCEQSLGLNARTAEALAVECWAKMRGRDESCQRQRRSWTTSTAAPGVRGRSVTSPPAEDATAAAALVGAPTDMPAVMETLPAHSIVDIWERANIANGRGVLLALGFDEAEVNVAQLSKVLEEELRSVEDEPQTMLMRAALALQAAELAAVRLAQKQLREENVKLRADSKDANQRVAMMAVEIDERHAALEDSTKDELRQLEQRHAAVVRELSARLAADREHWTSLTARLEERVRCFERDELRLKDDLETAQKENAELDADCQKLQKQVADLLEQNIQLNCEMAHLEDTVLPGKVCDVRDSDRVTQRTRSMDEEDELQQLVEKVKRLQLDNTKLRDKNDELVAEVESLNLEVTRLRTSSSKQGNKRAEKATSTLSTAGAPHEATCVTDEDDTEAGASQTGATKRRGDSPSKVHITEESPRLGKLRKCANEVDGGGGENSDTSGEWIALNSELQQQQQSSPQSTATLTKSEEVAALKANIEQLEEELKKARITVGSDAANNAVDGDVASGGRATPPEERCRELETSLEQMQRAYEDCEDYWQTKLSEERKLFEKERHIYEDEQQESDKKFTQLMEKVREYEEQYNKDGRLSPIQEKDILEQQYADLEAEADDLRESARQLLEEKSQEIETLQHEVEDLRLRLGESVEILTGACELEHEAAAAAAAQRNADANSSPANSPISYLWQQSTIQQPAANVASSSAGSSPSKRSVNLSTSETAIFSTTLLQPASHVQPLMAPIQKPSDALAALQQQQATDCETASNGSVRSGRGGLGGGADTHSVASTHLVHRDGSATSSTRSSSSSATEAPVSGTCTSPSPPSTSGIKEELKRLKFFEISLKEQIKDLTLKRDGLVMELQQLHEARPVLEKAYTRTVHPTLIQRVDQLELRNRHLQNFIKQQSQYTESIIQQNWRQHQVELAELHTRIEAQGGMLAEQVQRLQNADILVKELYVENAHLVATVQRLEQQRSRNTLMLQQQHLQQQHMQQHQHQQQQQQQQSPHLQQMHQRQGLNGLSGMP